MRFIVPAAMLAAVLSLGAGCAPAPQASDALAEADHVIEILDGGVFSPAELTVKAGDRVVWVNRDDELHWVASDPHPTHTGLSGFDARGEMRQGETYTFLFAEVGTFGYHDHAVARRDLTPTRGTVLVEP